MAVTLPYAATRDADAALRLDFRSDTITQPTSAMREAMKTARVGDDVFGEDPSINALERMVVHRHIDDDAVDEALAATRKLRS